jgi:ankyrin repeat protein
MGPAILMFLVAMVTLACDPGPLPPLRRTEADRRADWFPSQSNKAYPLDEAIIDGRLADTRSLLQNGADPNLRWSPSGDRFPLQVLIDHQGAPRVEALETARLLLHHGADPNARWCPFKSRQQFVSSPSCTSARGSTALMFATAAGNAPMVDLLLAAGADAGATDWLGGSALEYARNELTFEHVSRALFPEIRTRNRQALSYLTRVHDDGFVSTPLQRALADSHWYRVAPQSTPAKGDLHSYFASYRAARESWLSDRVRTLLTVGADPNQLMYRGGHVGGDELLPGIVMAMERGESRVLQTFLQHGADVNVRWCFSREPGCTLPEGTTPLMLAAAFGDISVVTLLLSFGADGSLADWKGRTAAHLARDREIQELILRGTTWLPRTRGSASR